MELPSEDGQKHLSSSERKSYLRNWRIRNREGAIYRNREKTRRLLTLLKARILRTKLQSKTPLRLNLKLTLTRLSRL